MIRCRHLAANEAALVEWLPTFQPAAATHLTHRCCAVLDRPPVTGEQQSMVAVLPEGAAAAGGAAGSGSSGGGPVVRALALSSSTAVCPAGKHLLYLWVNAGTNLSSASSSSQQAAAAALLSALAALADTRGLQRGGDPGEGATDACEPAEGKPAALWAAFYSQRSMQLLPRGGASSDGTASGRWPANVALCPGPDATASFVSAVEAGKACFWQLFPPDPPAAVAAAGVESNEGAAEAAAGAQAAAAAPLFPLDPQARRQQDTSEAEGAAAAEAGDDAGSDDEAVAALQAALRQVAGGDGGGGGGTAEEQPQ